MIAAGGLSGGLSSTIAGGKFIDGFRQGVITSGLNHVAHMFLEKQTIKGVLKRLNLKGEEKAPQTYASLQLLLSDPAMNSQYVWAGSPTIGDGRQMSISSLDNVRTNGETAAATTDTFGNGNIVMYGDSFKNWETLGFNMVHELQHRFQWSMGYIDRWMKKFDYNMNVVWNMAEYEAHRTVLSWGYQPKPGVLYLSPYSGVVNSYYPNTIK
ncbi:MAG: hypothetical protein DI588_18450 [Flavobacterium johnsoniae]|nr:MAG: hypothetical protein DI588_18450 [Flavobacterium johnsoniae]